MLEGLVRHAPPWELLLVWRQRANYHSVQRRARQLWARARAAVQSGGGARRQMASGCGDSALSLEPINQANPIETADVWEHSWSTADAPDPNRWAAQPVQGFGDR